MRFYWLRDRAEQGQVLIYWAPGEENWADYFTKHHSATHHRTVRPAYLNATDSPGDLQEGGIELLKIALTKRSQPLTARQTNYLIASASAHTSLLRRIIILVITLVHKNRFLMQ